MYYLITILSLLIHSCNTEYFSVNNIFSITENDTSYFGYSLQLQNDPIGFGRIIVGAPRTNSLVKQYGKNGQNDQNSKNDQNDQYGQNGQNGKNGQNGQYGKNGQYGRNGQNGQKSQNGAVYSCLIKTKKCEEFILEQNESQRNNIGLGSSLDAEESEDGFVVTCAPRWSDISGNSTKGMCFSIKNNALKKKHYPLEKISLIKNKTYYSQYGQVGFAAHLIKNQEHSLILGSPGIYSWTGTLAQYNSLEGEKSSTIATPIRNDNRIENYSYFGYSVTSGRFNISNPNQIFYVSGAPRNNNLYGSVNIFDPFENEPFTNRYMFKGTQFGEYFGASITTGKLNADDLDDIVIGAPTHSHDNEEDIGCIYVFQAVENKKMLQFKKYVKIKGEIKGSKFGFALSYLGDINNDGFGDVAVGAPYYDSTGAVYIYFGDENGLRNDYKQIIVASVIDSSLRGFGCSLSRGLDVDLNTNNDLAVGAYISGNVVLLTSRPVVKIQTDLRLNSGSQFNINTTYLIIKYCLTHKTDVRLPSYNINLTFAIMHTNQVTFENMNYKLTYMLNIKGENTTCDTFKILVNINDQILNGITLDMNYVISSTSSEEKFRPIEELHSPTTLQIPFNKGCSSSICKPNLKLTTFLTNMETNWIIGTPQNLQFYLLLENSGEPSYTNKLVIQVSPEYLKISQFPNYCDQTNNIVNCNFKYPILKNEEKNINFELDASKLKLDDTKIILNASIINDKDIDTSDNTNIIAVPLKSDVNFKIVPKSQIDEITGSQILNHQYNINNVGVTPVKYLKLHFLVPYEIKQTKFLSVNVTGCSRSFIYENFTSITDEKDLVLDFPTDNSLFINCTSLKGDHVTCKMIECEIRNSLNSFSVNITMMINTNLIGDLHNEGPIILSTTLEPDYKFISTSSHIWTKLVVKQQTASITMYLIIGILVSLLFVFILIFILYKCGFFTKKKLPDKSDYENLLETNEPQL